MGCGPSFEMTTGGETAASDSASQTGAATEVATTSETTEVTTADETTAAETTTAGETTQATTDGATTGEPNYEFTVVDIFLPGFACVWDPNSGDYFVLTYEVPDGHNRVVRIGSDFAVVANPWVEVASAGGLATFKDTLIATSNVTIYEFDLNTSEIHGSHVFPGFHPLGDLAVDPATGEAYVSSDSIARFTAGDFTSGTEFLASQTIGVAGGLHLEAGMLYVGAEPTAPEFVGPLIAVDTSTSELVQVGPYQGRLEGVARWGSQLVLTDRAAEKLIAIDDEGESSVFLDLKTDHDFAPYGSLGVNPAKNVLCVPGSGGVGFVEFF